MKEGDKVWLAKYALSNGIKEVEVVLINKRFPDYARLSGYDWDMFCQGKDFFPSKQEAINKANEMRDKKIKSLEKQIEKLKKLTF